MRLHIVVAIMIAWATALAACYSWQAPAQPATAGAEALLLAAAV
jgi:hypothetical protein